MIKRARHEHHAGGTSFFNHTFQATPETLKRAFGYPQYGTNDGKDKTNYDWLLTVDGQVFTIYDWKYYRSLKDDELITWHIGAHNAIVGAEALKQVQDLLANNGTRTIDI